MREPKLISVTAVEPSRLRLAYETGEVKLFDVAPYIKGSWYGELRDPTYFRTVHLIDGGAGIAWANGQDLAPHELYELSRDDGAEGATTKKTAQSVSDCAVELFPVFD